VAHDAVHVGELCLTVPSGRAVRLRGDYGCIPREQLDFLLWDGAREAGACVLEAFTGTGVLERSGRVVGMRFLSPAGPHEIQADVTLLATGANTVPLRACGLDAAAQPDAVAGRAYFEATPELAARFRSLTIVYLGDWCPGYGWIFPSPGHRFNIGVGLFAGSAGGGRLQQFWRDFLDRCPAAAAIAAGSRQVAPFRGAPLRTGLSRGLFGRPGLLVIGEAAATTYPATGEGIGKAMESGLLAAAVAADCGAGRLDVERAPAAYGAEFRARFERRYSAYAVAQRWASHPLVLNLIAARATTGRFAREELEALVSERGDAHRLFSPWGLARALVG
jgi:flavin-dependent dehydrogenase